ncbi:MAG: hypothetical protein IT382_06070 [Deltaproteobacteria bacterium]|jgi:hypothetical protein|nr:hypothetical protein [Deltaproteobacteria bacterium]
MSERTPGKDDVWVEMEVLKGTLVSVYRGRLTGADFEAWRKGELKGAVPLNDTYWSYDEGDGNEGWVVVGATPGPYASAVGTTWVRAELILVMVPLRDGSERETHKLRPVGGSRDDVY